MQRLQIRITGIVQGVGFRPFVYKLAQQYALTGWVQNDSEGVLLEVQGSEQNMVCFQAALVRETPPLASIDRVLTIPLTVVPEEYFFIRHSTAAAAKLALVSPDMAVCPECLADITDKHNRRYGYAFTNCTNCGPRYSIIADVPYDREKTSMRPFGMCPQCAAEYRDPLDRRFHAQPNACPVCGPHYRLLDREGQELDGDWCARVRGRIGSGDIIAIKGIGGFHLACDARQEAAVATLRQRKLREEKPFAVMCGSLAAARELCDISEEAEQLLESSIRPIVLLPKRPGLVLAEQVAPGNAYLGVMLPYTPLHYTLLAPGDVWVMTSGNHSDEPIAYEDADARQRLAAIADYFLVYNRTIVRRVDDSVVRVFNGQTQLLRRSRGMAPAPLAVAGAGPTILAGGGEQKNTFCLLKGSQAFVSEHIGDLANMAVLASYEQAIAHYQQLFAAVPAVTAYDLHPEYLSTKYILSLPLTSIGVQHHHAHIASVLAEHGLDEPVIGVAFDGTGYGADGNLWGGEFLLADCRQFTRLAHCSYLPLPGGSKAIQEPWRLAAWLAYEQHGWSGVEAVLPLRPALPNGWQLAIEAARQGLNTPLTSSAGRLFDAAAALLGVRTHCHYEGQAAIELEQLAVGCTGQLWPYQLLDGPVSQLDFKPTFAALMTGAARGQSKGELAASFHRTVAAALVNMTRRLCRQTGIKKVVLSGGVFQNILLLTEVMTALQPDYEVLINRKVPPNDGGLALGQAVIARERSR